MALANEAVVLHDLSPAAEGRLRKVPETLRETIGVVPQALRPVDLCFLTSANPGVPSNETRFPPHRPPLPEGKPPGGSHSTDKIEHQIHGDDRDKLDDLVEGPES